MYISGSFKKSSFRCNTGEPENAGNHSRAVLELARYRDTSACGNNEYPKR